MKTLHLFLTVVLVAAVLASCSSGGNQQQGVASVDDTAPGPGQSAVVDDVSQKNVVGVAVASPDHTTLVTAVKAASLVDVLSNAGPFTVFAPEEQDARTAATKTTVKNK